MARADEHRQQPVVATWRSTTCCRANRLWTANKFRFNIAVLMNVLTIWLADTTITVQICGCRTLKPGWKITFIYWNDHIIRETGKARQQKPSYLLPPYGRGDASSLVEDGEVAKSTNRMEEELLPCEETWLPAFRQVASAKKIAKPCPISKV